MKLLAVFLLCCLAAASATSGFSSEYGLLEDVESVLGKYAEKIREHLQQALDKLKAKIQEHSYIFEALKDQIDIVQQRIHEVVRVTKGKIIDKVLEVKQYLTNLLKKFLDKIHHKEEEKLGYALYELDEGSFLERLAQKIKASLERFVDTVMKKVEEYKEIGNDIKEKLLAIKEKLQEIPKASAAKLLELAQKIKEQLKALLREAIERVSQKEEEEVSVYAMYESNDEGFLTRMAQRVKTQLEKFLNRIVELVNKYSDIAENIKDKILAIKEKLQEIPSAGAAKLIQIAQKVKEQLRALLKEAVDKIAEKHEEPAGYALYDSEGGFLANLAERIRDHLQSVLEGIQERLEKYHLFAVEFKERVLAIKEKLQEFKTATGAKMLEIALKLGNQLKELLRDSWDKIHNKQVAEYSLTTLGDDTLIGTFGRLLREKLQLILNRIKERLEQHREIFEAFKAKLEEIQENINEMSQSVMTRAISLAQAIKTKLTELIKAIADKIGGFVISFPYEDRSAKPGDSSRRRLQTYLDELVKRVSKYPEIHAQFQEKLEALQEKVNSVADLSGLELALTASRVGREIGALRAEILAIIGTRPSN